MRVSAVLWLKDPKLDRSLHLLLQTLLWFVAVEALCLSSTMTSSYNSQAALPSLLLMELSRGTLDPDTCPTCQAS